MFRKLLGLLKRIHIFVLWTLVIILGSAQTDRIQTWLHPQWEIIEKSWSSLLKRADQVRHIDEINFKLRAENTELRFQLESERFEQNGKKAQITTEKNEIRLGRETGSKTGRVLASLTYQVPADLLPNQLFALGVNYFKLREDEKAAVIFSHLANLEEDGRYRTSKHLVATGISWYRLENYALAEDYFNEALKKPEQEDSIRYQSQALLWKALIAKKLNKEVKSQYWLTELLDRHPRAPETSWVNGFEAVEGQRSLANEKPKEKQHSKEEKESQVIEKHDHEAAKHAEPEVKHEHH